jgi:8-oxo-dGTP pyrophosphatase MutT (NUDIX family)
MGVDELLRVLAAHSPVDEREALSIAQMLDVIPTLSEPFDEEADLVHVTASALIVDDPRHVRHVVLHKHKRLGLWLQPGGHIEVGETIAVAALREAREETGLDVAHPVVERFLHCDVHPGPRGHTHLDVRYVVVAPFVAPNPPVGESQEVRWFTLDDALAIADAGLRGALVAVSRPEDDNPYL